MPIKRLFNSKSIYSRTSKSYPEIQFIYFAKILLDILALRKCVNKSKINKKEETAELKVAYC